MNLGQYIAQQLLEAGDKVTITAGTASTVHATVGVELIYNPLTT